MIKTRRFVSVFILFVFCVCGVAASLPDIPSLDWEQRSDWVSVKTPKTWHGLKAVGDGKADDTSAIQQTLAEARRKGGTVYLPPGRYRITDTILWGTLRADSDMRPAGMTIIGHGRDTVLVWDGLENAPMMRMMGTTWCRIIGVTFEGRNKASIAIDMGGTAFQGHNLFRHCAFKNCRKGGVVTGLRKMQTACTEQRIDNCLFDNCGTGILLGDFNDYDCVIDGCEIRNCDYGIWTFKGNFYCRDTHFEKNRKGDIRQESEHTCTARRCTSYGSACFVIGRQPHNSTVIQDCHVSDWTGKAAVLQNITPMLVFDSSFVHSKPEAVAIAFEHTDSERLVGCNRHANSSFFKLVESNNIMGKIVPADKVRRYSIPKKDVLLPNGLNARTSFLKTKAVHAAWTNEPNTAAIPGKIFDVKRDFGAKGGEHDDTEAIRKAIAAAKAHGKGAMVYFPMGHYAIKDTIVLDGKDWCFGSCGIEAMLSWYGKEGGVLFHVKAPESLLIEGFDALRMGGRKDGIDILHTGNEGHSSMVVYDSVKCYGFLIAQPEVRGFHFKDLGAQDCVMSLGTFGNMRFENCQDASILISTHYEGTIRVMGRNTSRKGLTAFQFALLEICHPCIWIQDNNSFVITDFYNEQSQSIYRIEGNGCTTPGRLSLGVIKNEGTSKTIAGYNGEIIFGTPQYYSNTCNADSTLKLTEPANLDVLALAPYFFHHSLNMTQQPNARLYFLAAGGGPNSKMTADAFLKQHADSKDEKALELAAKFLYDMRRVGKLDLRYYHSVVK